VREFSVQQKARDILAGFFVAMSGLCSFARTS
jgi:hypothetical protein